MNLLQTILALSLVAKAALALPLVAIAFIAVYRVVFPAPPGSPFGKVSRQDYE